MLLLLLPSLALAAEGHEEHGGSPWATLIFSTINTLLFLFVLKRFAWPAISSWVVDRRKAIVEAIDALPQVENQQALLKKAVTKGKSK